jgi:hypothetical protein
MELQTALPLLARTPATLQMLVGGLPAAWTESTEGPNTWAVYDVVGHLIDGERDAWMPRARIILAQEGERRFPPFDRFTHLAETPRPTLAARLQTFADLRARSLEALDALQLTPADLERTATHPDLGCVTLRQLLSTWVAHDLDHLSQITRVLAKALADDVGPWRGYLRVLRSS